MAKKSEDFRAKSDDQLSADLGNLKREAFEKWRTGYASAFAIVLFVTVFAAANIYVKALNSVKNR